MEQLIGNEINGLQTEGSKLFLVQECVREEITGEITKHTKCEYNTSCYGATLELIKVFHTPYGVVEFLYKAWGGSLEHTSKDWRVVGENEVEELACRAMEAARLATELADKLRKMKNR